MRFLQFIAAVVLLVMWPRVVLAQSQSNPSAVVDHSARKQTQGFFDYALGKINPAGTDYGASLQQARDAAVDHSIDDLYFWSNVVTLLLLTGAVSVILLQWRSADKKEVIVSTIITQLWNGRVSDRMEVEERTRKLNSLVETRNAQIETTFTAANSEAEQRKGDARSLTRSLRRLSDSAQPESTKQLALNLSPANGSTAAIAEAGHTDSSEDILLLRRQLEAMQNTEQNLRQRLNQTLLLLDEERRKNGTLKGA